MPDVIQPLPAAEGRVDRPVHPEWKRYWTARNAWEETLCEGAKFHRQMEDAAEEIEKLGEMVLDRR